MKVATVSLNIFKGAAAPLHSINAPPLVFCLKLFAEYYTQVTRVHNDVIFIQPLQWRRCHQATPQVGGLEYCDFIRIWWDKALAWAIDPDHRMYYRCLKPWLSSCPAVQLSLITSSELECVWNPLETQSPYRSQEAKPPPLFAVRVEIVWCKINPGCSIYKQV